MLFENLAPKTNLTVVNVYHDDYDEYIGRENKKLGLKASIFHNPFIIGRDGTRDEVLELYRPYIKRKLDRGEIPIKKLLALQGKRVACYCAPNKRCHGHILDELISEYRHKVVHQKIIIKRNITLLVTGGRDYNNRYYLFKRLDELHKEYVIKLLVHGGATGADSLADEWAKERGVKVRAKKAQWRKYGKGAGHIRNREMHDKNRPDAVAAFPGNNGTANMVEIAEKAGTKVVYCDGEESRIIGEFVGPYRFLSNFYYSPLKISGIVYPTVEHAFQAAKTLDLDEKIKISEANKPGIAKRMGRQVALRKDWEEIKDKIMYKLVLAKFRKYGRLRKQLFATDNYVLVEGNVWHDNHFGDCLCPACENIPGKNKLGKIEVRVRKELRLEFAE